MQRSRLGAIALGTAALLGAALASPALAATDSEIPTFSEFHASTFKDADQQYIVNGDEPVADTGDLKAFYDRWSAARRRPSRTASIVNTVGGADDKWSTSQVGNLTYCVSTKFGTRNTDVVNAMNSGAGLLGGARPSKINFVYVPVAGRQLHDAQQQRAVLGRARADLAVHRPRVLPEHAQALAQRPGRRLDLDLGLLDADQHPGPRARPHARLPPRAHPPRGRHLLRGQQLAPADAVRLVLDHALPAVQRHLEQPQHDRDRPPGRSHPLRRLIA